MTVELEHQSTLQHLSSESVENAHLALREHACGSVCIVQRCPALVHPWAPHFNSFSSTLELRLLFSSESVFALFRQVVGDDVLSQTTSGRGPMGLEDKMR